MVDFVVTSQGRTASYWFAAALDAHGYITCGHSRQNPPVPDYYGKGGGGTLDDGIIAMGELPGDPIGYTRYLHDFGTTPVFGSVHAFGVEAAGELQQSDLSVAHLTRHPITRITSMSDRNIAEARQSTIVADRIHNSVSNNLGEFKELNELRDNAPKAEWYPFAAACFDAAYEATLIGKYDLVLQSERLTSDPDYFAWAVRRLAGVRVTSDYLETVFSMGQLNSSIDFRGFAGDMFSRWASWKKDVFRCFFIHYPFAEFEKLQYDIMGVLDANLTDGEWNDHDAEAKSAFREGGDVVRNCGVINPSTVRAGSVIDIFLRVQEGDAENFAIELRSETRVWQNNTTLLGKPIPVDTELLKITFRAPTEPGTYRFEAISELRSVWKTKLVVATGGMRLDANDLVPDVDILRASIEPV